MKKNSQNENIDYEGYCNENGVFFIFGDINEDLTKNCISWLYAKSTKNKKDNLELVINSEGGDPLNAFAICDIIEYLNLKIKTIAIGSVCSSSLLIFMAGEKGQRKISKNCQILSHQYFWGVDGKSHELKSINKEFKIMDKRFINHYKKHTNLNEKTIKNNLLCSTDIWLTPEEAKKYNICDIIF